MTENEQAPGYEPRVAPPTQPNTTPRPPRTSGWPTVLGTIAIVFGAFGVLGGVWAIVAPVFVEQMANLGLQQDVKMAAMRKWASWSRVSAVATIAAAMILLAGGIGLVKRAHWGVGVIQAWAVIRMAVAVGSGVLAGMVQWETLAGMRQQGFPIAGETVMAFSVAFSVLWGWALPVFMLIWFGRRRIRDEVAGWGQDRTATG